MSNSYLLFLLDGVREDGRELSLSRACEKAKRISSCKEVLFSFPSSSKTPQSPDKKPGYLISSASFLLLPRLPALPLPSPLIASLSVHLVCSLSPRVLCVCLGERKVSPGGRGTRWREAPHRRYKHRYRDSSGLECRGGGLRIFSPYACPAAWLFLRGVTLRKTPHLEGQTGENLS